MELRVPPGRNENGAQAALSCRAARKRVHPADRCWKGGRSCGCCLVGRVVRQRGATAVIEGLERSRSQPEGNGYTYRKRAVLRRRGRFWDNTAARLMRLR